VLKFVTTAKSDFHHDNHTTISTYSVTAAASSVCD